jgi:hypothetical protein
MVDGGWWVVVVRGSGGSSFNGSPFRAATTARAEDTMDSKMTIEVEGVASAQLVRPDVAQAKWLAFPLAAMAWGLNQRMAMHRDTQQPWTITDMEPNAIVLVDQLADFDAWRVGGGVAFRW